MQCVLPLCTPPPLDCHTVLLQNLLCIELCIWRSTCLQGLEPQTTSDTPDAPEPEDTLLSHNASVELATAGVYMNTPACVQSDYLSDTGKEEGEELQVPPPPDFGEEAGKDNLQSFLHNLDAWYYSAKSTINLKRTSCLSSLHAEFSPMPHRPLEWLKHERASIESTASKQGSEGSASQLPMQYTLLLVLKQALRMELNYFSSDRKQELYAMGLRAGDNVVGFALKSQTFCRP